MDVPDGSLQRRIEAVMGRRPATWQRAEGGYTPAQRWVVSFEDGTSCFVKTAASQPGSPMDEWLRREHDVYSRLAAASFLPRLLGWDDDGTQPMLVLEDLSDAHWPPPWTHDRVEAVRGMLEEVHACQLDGLPPAEVLDPDLTRHWAEVQANSRPFLSLGLCSESWLRVGLPALIDSAGQADLSGNELVHFDVRSDNLCFVEGRTLLIDWNFASRGNGDLDLAAWLPSLHSEGGPAPEALLPHAPQWAATISGYFASQAGLPPIAHAPRVRQVQLSQLRSALPWAVRALGLPPLDGPSAP
jgi:hypothetical protein